MAETIERDILTEYLSIVNAAIAKLELCANSGVAFVHRESSPTAGIVAVIGNLTSKVAFAANASQIDAKDPFSGELGAMLEKIIASVTPTPVNINNKTDTAHCILLAEETSIKAAGLPKCESKIIVAFGSAAISALCGIEANPIAGRFIVKDDTKIMPTHGLLELSENANLKKETWAHLKSVIAELAK